MMTWLFLFFEMSNDKNIIVVIVVITYLTLFHWLVEIFWKFSPNSPHMQIQAWI